LHVEDPLKIIPATGVYAVIISYQHNDYKGMLNIGYRPTVNGQAKNRTIEVNIFDFQNNIYGKTLKVSFVKLIRRELKFEKLGGLAQNTARRVAWGNVSTIEIICQRAVTVAVIVVGYLGT